MADKKVEEEDSKLLKIEQGQAGRQAGFDFDVLEEGGEGATLKENIRYEDDPFLFSRVQVPFGN